MKVSCEKQDASWLCQNEACATISVGHHEDALAIFVRDQTN